MTYRFATLEDLSLLAELNRELIQDEGQPERLSPVDLINRMRGWLENNYRAVLFEEGEGVVAYALFCFGERLPDERFVFVRQFFVQRACRKQGVGRTAVRLLLEEILPPKTRVLLDVLYENDSARRFWKAVGFKEHCLTLESFSKA